MRGGKFKRPSVRIMSQVESAYVGAMLDAEGCVNFHRGGKNGGKSWHVQIVNAQIELISALIRATGVGRVYYQSPNLGRKPKRKKGLWTWSVTARFDVLSLAEQLAPYSLKAQLLLKNFYIPFTFNT